MVIAGIGTRKPYQEDADECIVLGRWIGRHPGWRLRTGGAEGCDQLFAQGFRERGGIPELLLPWPGFNSYAWGKDDIIEVPVLTNEELTVCQQAHERWHRVSDGARKLFMRNMAVLREVDVVLAYPNDHQSWGGGTGHTMRCAGILGITVFDLTQEDGRVAAKGWFDAHPWKEVTQ